MLHREQIRDVVFRRAVDLLDAGDLDGLREHLETHPELARQRVLFQEGANYFGNPSLLEFIAGNPIRHGKLPANIVAVARAILQEGAEPEARDAALGLVATGRVARECGVQVALIELLCESGADPNGAAHAAAAHGEFAAVEALIRLGAKVDLPIAAALGRGEEFAQLLPAASAGQRHLALALAAQFGRVEIVRALLDAGENPDRYNPAGAHAHSTPLHQAALAGHADVVHLLVARGARLDIKDTLWHGTPERWARHERRTEIADCLRERSAETQA